MYTQGAIFTFVDWKCRQRSNNRRRRKLHPRRGKAQGRSRRRTQPLLRERTARRHQPEPPPAPRDPGRRRRRRRVERRNKRQQRFRLLPKKKLLWKLFELFANRDDNADDFFARCWAPFFLIMITANQSRHRTMLFQPFAYFFQLAQFLLFVLRMLWNLPEMALTLNDLTFLFRSLNSFVSFQQFFSHYSLWPIILSL